MQQLSQQISLTVCPDFRPAPDSEQDSLLDKGKLLARMEKQLVDFIDGGAEAIVKSSNPDQELLQFVVSMVNGAVEPDIQNQAEFGSIRVSLRKLLNCQDGTSTYHQQVQRASIDRILILAENYLLGSGLRYASQLAGQKLLLDITTEQQEFLLAHLRSQAVEMWRTVAMHSADASSVERVFSGVNDAENSAFQYALTCLMADLQAGLTVERTINAHGHGAGGVTPFKDVEVFKELLWRRWNDLKDTLAAMAEK